MSNTVCYLLRVAVAEPANDEGIQEIFVFRFQLYIEECKLKKYMTDDTNHDSAPFLDECLNEIQNFFRLHTDDIVIHCGQVQAGKAKSLTESA